MKNPRQNPEVKRLWLCAAMLSVRHLSKRGTDGVKKEGKSMEKEQLEQLQSEFKELCKPLNSWLQKNYHPHAKIIIETDHAEIVEGAMAVPLEVVD